jgi:pyridoxamine 5'-phosphate oxidase
MDSNSILDESQAEPTPFPLFARWMAEAEATQLNEPYATMLATCTADGRPSARMVLIRRHDERGFCFFTNYHSRKAEELAHNPRAALVLYWDPLARQIRIEGRIEVATAAESDAYFATRERGHQLSAWASPQSRVLASRAVLESAVADVERRFHGQPVPRPDFWGGYRLVPESIEFWQGAENRLHDRLCYRRQADGSWLIERLAP